MDKPTAYKLEPSHSVAMFHDPTGPSGKRMGFAYNDLWVTPLDEREMYPAGDFVNYSEGGEGLPKFVAQKRSLNKSPVVAWHTFGLHHMPRLEDFPVQPVIRCGFKLMPSGFFDRNPGIDLGPETDESSCKAGAAKEGL